MNLRLLSIIIHVLLSLCLLVGCVNEKKTEAVSSLVYETEKVQADMSEYVSDVDFMPLRPIGEHFVGRVDKVACMADRIYVADCRANKIFCYDMDGNPKGVVARHGRGPGEYLEIHDISVDGDRIYILDNSVGKLLVYDSSDFSFKYDLKLPFNVWDFEVLSDGGFIFAYAPSQGNPVKEKSKRYRVFITDGELRVKDSKFEYGTNETDAFMFRNYLSVYGEKVVYASLADDSYHIFDRRNGEYLKSVEIRLEDALPSGERSDISMLSESNLSYQNEVPVLCDGYAVFKFTIKGIGTECFICSDRNIFHTNPPGTMKDAIFGIVAGNGNHLIANWGSNQIYSYVISSGFVKAEPEDEALILDNYAFLVKYSMK